MVNDVGPWTPDYKVRQMVDDNTIANASDVAAALAIQSDLSDAQADIVALQTATANIATDETRIAALRSDQAIVAGPTALADALFLTKAVLRKTLTVAAGPNASTVNTAHGITSPVAIIGCVIQLTNGTNHLCFGQGGMLSDTIAHSILVTIDGTNVVMTSGSGGDYHLYAGHIILLYTLS